MPNVRQHALRVKLDPYNMELHEQRNHTGQQITRVPGGWLWQLWNYDTDRFNAPVFVPYNNEFERRV